MPADIQHWIVPLAAMLVATLCAGFAAGLFGIGGGFVVVPALFLVLPLLGSDNGHLAHAAVGTSLATIVVTSLRSVQAHARRGAVDFEYETQMVGMNRVMNPHVETVFLAASPETQFISSTLVRQIAGMDGDISPFVPPHVKDKVLARVAEQKKSR